MRPVEQQKWHSDWSEAFQMRGIAGKRRGEPSYKNQPQTQPFRQGLICHLHHRCLMNAKFWNDRPTGLIHQQTLLCQQAAHVRFCLEFENCNPTAACTLVVFFLTGGWYPIIFGYTWSDTTLETCKFAVGVMGLVEAAECLYALPSCSDFWFVLSSKPLKAIVIPSHVQFPITSNLQWTNCKCFGVLILSQCERVWGQFLGHTRSQVTRFATPPAGSMLFKPFIRAKVL